MMFEFGDTEDAKKFLTNDNWLVFNFGEGGFAEFLEYEYFEPGTSKNAEYEVMTMPIEGRISFWFRIRDTEKNRDNLRKALSEFYGPVKNDIDTEIEKMQEEIKKTAEKLEGGK